MKRKFDKAIAETMATRIVDRLTNAILDKDEETVLYYSKKLDGLLRAMNSNGYDMEIICNVIKQ